jgi:hypothetical protein
MDIAAGLGSLHAGARRSARCILLRDFSVITKLTGITINNPVMTLRIQYTLECTFVFA